MKEKTMRIVNAVFWAIAGALIPTVLACVGFTMYKKYPRIEYYEFNIDEKAEGIEWKYDMLPYEISDYICNLCEKLELDSDLVVAILLRENPEINPEAVHRNINGSTDEGLFQLNNKYSLTVFVPAYWKINEEFNQFNWKMNTYLACKHLAYLSKELKVFDDIVCAYNCGAGRTMSGDIPASTRQYLASVKNTYRLLKEAENGRERNKERSE